MVERLAEIAGPSTESFSLLGFGSLVYSENHLTISPIVYDLMLIRIHNSPDLA